jgi:NADPH2:quinone reductase
LAAIYLHFNSKAELLVAALEAKIHDELETTEGAGAEDHVEGLTSSCRYRLERIASVASQTHELDNGVRLAVRIAARRSMRAVQVDRPGDAGVLQLTRVPVPSARSDEVLVAVSHAGVNFADVLMRSHGSTTTCPFVPGVEGSGVVREVGEQVRDFVPGDRVAWAPVSGASSVGSYAEFAVVPPGQLLRVPEQVPLSIAAAVTLQGLTAQYLATDIRPLGPGDTVLVHAAAGGTGRLVVQWACHLGARVIGTVSSDEKAEVARAAGTHHVVRYDRHDVPAAVADLTGGAGVDYVVDGIGGATIRTDLACVARRGTIAVFGRAAGTPEPISPLELVPKSVALVGGYMNNFLRDRTEVDAKAARLWAAVVAGWLEPLVEELPLEKAAVAHERLAGRRTVGKLVLEVDGTLA